jgi:hypothetical protein
MHPELTRLAAYLDGALGPGAQAELRAHILTCRVCAARLAQLRDDAGRIERALADRPPDLRAAVRVRMRRPGRPAWLAQGAGLVAGLAALLLFAMLLGGGTAARVPDLLVVTDRVGQQVVALDPATGAQLNAHALGAMPSAIVYDHRRSLLYVLAQRAVVALDLATLAPAARWEAPHEPPAGANLALDARSGQLYLAQPGGIAALALGPAQLTLARSYSLGANPQMLAITPDGAALFALEPGQARLWRIDVTSGAGRSQVLAGADSARSGWLASSRDGTALYVLLTRATPDGQPGIWQIDRNTLASQSIAISQQPAPWDFELLDNGQLAVARGNGAVGGVELLDTSPLSSTALLDAAHDQHHIVAGVGGTLFGLNFSHSTITRYDAAARSVVWRTATRTGWQPWDGVLVPGGWRWPWQR